MTFDSSKNYNPEASVTPTSEEIGNFDSSNNYEPDPSGVSPKGGGPPNDSGAPESAFADN